MVAIGKVVFTSLLRLVLAAVQRDVALVSQLLPSATSHAPSG
jgi:hypothetical protein